MFWQEIYLDRIIKKYELINTLHYIFAVDEKEVLICTNIANYDVGNEIKIICETSFLETSYPLKICIFIKEDSIIPPNDILCIGEMAERLECKILMSDDSI